MRAAPPGVTSPTRAANRLYVASAEAIDTCCSRMSRMRVGNPGSRRQKGGSGASDTALARSASRSASRASARWYAVGKLGSGSCTWAGLGVIHAGHSMAVTRHDAY